MAAPPLAPTALPAADVSPERLEEACGDPPGAACEWALDLTGSEALADIAEWAIDIPLRILIITVVAWIVARIAGRAVSAAVRRTASDSVKRRIQQAAVVAPALRESEESAARSSQRIEAISRVMGSSAKLFVYVTALFLVLAEIGVNLAPLLAGAGIAGVALGFGAQTMVRDFLTGVFILLEDQYAVGDTINVGDAEGVVENVSLRSTRLRSVDGVVWHIPNGEVLLVGNMSQHWSRSLLDIEVAYDTEIARAKELIAEVARGYADDDEDVLEEPEVWGVEALGASGITIRLVIKTKPSEQWRISRDIRELIKARFDEEGIEIPFPTQTLFMRSEGGTGSDSPGGGEPGQRAA